MVVDHKPICLSTADNCIPDLVDMVQVIDYLLVAMYRQMLIDVAQLKTASHPRKRHNSIESVHNGISWKEVVDRPSLTVAQHYLPAAQALLVASVASHIVIDLSVRVSRFMRIVTREGTDGVFPYTT